MTANQPRAARDQVAALGRWSRIQAIAMTLAIYLCVSSSAAWPLAAIAICSFLLLLIGQRGAWTPSASFGRANAVTCLRLALILPLTLPRAMLSSQAALLVVGGVFALDGLDGRLARRRGEVSAFGAHFDMETDAFLVLALTLRLWLAEGHAPWVLLSGCLRYGYVLWLWAWPHASGEAPRSRFGRWAFALLLSGLGAGLVLPGFWGTCAVAIGTAVVTGSFARSFYYSTRRA